jgi:hypothetical protein
MNSGASPQGVLNGGKTSHNFPAWMIIKNRSLCASGSL